jgi:23S rRNA pseudouridine2605 synthase
MAAERLQKIMAQAGVASRRASEELILAGRVRVNGAVAELGQKADPVSDKITVDGRVLQAAEQKVYIALNKPKYVLSTVEPERGDTRQTVRDLIPGNERLYPVGRLDFDSEGLILMTNDGDLAQKLTHPSHGHVKVYRVLLARQPDHEQLAAWRRGVVLEDGYKTQPADVYVEREFGKGAWVKVSMREGRKHQIRETGSLLGLPVVRILRISIGSLHLGTLKPGEWRHLTAAEVDALKSGKLADVPRPRPPVRSAAAGRRKSDTPLGVERPSSAPPSSRKGRKPGPPPTDMRHKPARQTKKPKPAR